LSKQRDQRGSGIIVIGCFYIASPERLTGSFGLKPPAGDADTRAWLRLKGIRDIASGLAVLTLMLASNGRTVGIVMLLFALIRSATCPTFLLPAAGRQRRSQFTVLPVRQC
jgi:hypothetical protein